jgi:hypothetical protein
MKKFSQAKIVLFDSTIACFKLSVEALFTKRRQDNTYASLAYITDQGTANLNPNIYLVFAYKGETYEATKTLYTSYPQLFKIRQAMEKMKDLVVDNKGFMDVEGVTTVRPDNQEPIVVTEIGKNKKWMSFALTAIATTEQGLPPKVPGVTIQLSDSEYVSVLTAEEFLTVYSIVKDVDLSGIQATLSTMYLQADDAAQPYGYPQQQQPMYQQPQYAPQQQQYQQPQQQFQQQPSAGYNRQPMRQQQKPQTRVMQAPVPDVSQSTAQMPTYTPKTQRAESAPQQSSPNLPPRQQKNIVNIDSVQETPVSTINFNDEDAIASIFSDDGQ